MTEINALESCIPIPPWYTSYSDGRAGKKTQERKQRSLLLDSEERGGGGDGRCGRAIEGGGGRR
eukprot:658574-Rhodomonas_salina.1